jgi:hypothetical protein
MHYLIKQNRNHRAPNLTFLDNSRQSAPSYAFPRQNKTQEKPIARPEQRTQPKTQTAKPERGIGREITQQKNIFQLFSLSICVFNLQNIHLQN